MDGEKQPRKWPLQASGYKLLEEIGYGVSAKVWRAVCVPYNEIVAIKIVDLEKCSANLEDIRREAQVDYTQAMSLLNHQNLVKSFCTFLQSEYLWVVMPFFGGGSVHNILCSTYPNGLEETHIAVILRETLKGLDYLHKNGHIHRDVKAGNILVDDKGNVKLADFGAMAGNVGERGDNRSTFIGTPCWMAPEILEQGVRGYDWRADIWSFGITIIELAKGQAPHSKVTPIKAMLMTLKDPAPSLTEEGNRTNFSKGLKELVAMCMKKKPEERPSAAKLLEHRFVKSAKSTDHFARHVIEKLQPLGERVRLLKEKEAKRRAESENENKGQRVEGGSGWDYSDVAPLVEKLTSRNSGTASTGNPRSGGEHSRSGVEHRGRFNVTYNSSDESELSTEAGKGPSVGAKLNAAKSSERIGRFNVSKNENNDDLADSNGTVQNQRGRFSVTEGTSSSQSQAFKEQSPSISVSLILPYLHGLLLQAAVHQDAIRSLITVFQENKGKRHINDLNIPWPQAAFADMASKMKNPAQSESNVSLERELHTMVIDLQKQVSSLHNQNQTLKKRNQELDHQLNTIRIEQLNKEEAEERRREGGYDEDDDSE